MANWCCGVRTVTTQTNYKITGRRGDDDDARNLPRPGCWSEGWGCRSRPRLSPRRAI